jgi:phosphonate transport system substrate-binding protein
MSFLQHFKLTKTKLIAFHLTPLRMFLTLPLFLLSSCCSIPETRLKIGIVTTRDTSESLASLRVLKFEVEKRLPQVTLDPDATTDYQEAKKRICSGEWQLSFVLSPLVTAQAIDCGQKPLFQVLGSSTYQAAYFVRGNSSLSSLKGSKDKIFDQLENTTLALNQVGSASGFYVPLYELYGRRFKKILLLGSYEKIKSQVYSGQVDVGVAPLTTITGNTTFPKNAFKIIATSFDIPEGAVLIDPKLNPCLSDKLIDILKLKEVYTKVKAPDQKNPKIHDLPLYDPDTPLPSYKLFVPIISKVDGIGNCYKKQPAIVDKCN